MQKPTISELRTLRNVLLVTDTVGLIFAVLTSLLRGGVEFLIVILFLSLSGLSSLWVRRTEMKEGAIQLPLFPTNADANVHSHSQSYRTGLRQGLIAVGDFVSGAFLVAFHVVFIVLGGDYYDVRVLSLYAVFAMLAAAAMHFVLGWGHFMVWREERGRNSRGVCRVCRQRMGLDGESGQVLEINEGAGTVKIGAEDRVVGH